jgi:glycosyltransferase involved in cell wall biosynthesis
MSYKIIHFSESDIGGGSAFYAYRLHKYLNKIQKVNSKMFVLKKNLNDNSIKKLSHEHDLRYLKYLYFFFLNNKNKYSFYNYGKYLIKEYYQLKEILAEKPDAIIVYNNSNLIHPKILNFLEKQKVKLIFYPMDMELITGGCHYNFECNGYKKSCKPCPAVNLSLITKPSKNLLEKKKYFNDIKIIFLSATRQIYKNVSKSILFNKKKHKNLILNLGLDLKLYKPIKKVKKNKIIISLRSSLNPRKGNFILIEALKYICFRDIEINKKLSFNIVGDSSLLEFLKENNFEYSFKSTIKNENELIKFYQNSDFFLNQSIQDAGPVMVNEALACGVPVVSFKIGISNDVIKNNFNGYLASDISKKKLGDKIIEIINIKTKHLNKMKKNARKTAIKNFNINEKTKDILKIIR